MARPSDPYNVTPYVHVGVEFIGVFGVLLAGGIWLDSRLDSSPAMTVLGALLGFAGGMYRLIRQMLQLHRRGTGSAPPPSSEREP